MIIYTGNPNDTVAHNYYDDHTHRWVHTTLYGWRSWAGLA